MQSSGILVVDRPAFIDRVVVGGVAQLESPQELSPRTSTDLVRQYRGLEGDPWPAPAPSFVVDGQLAALSNWPEITTYLRSLGRADDPDVILVGDCGLSADKLTESDWLFAGFDLGYFENEWSHYSSVFHEVLFGKQIELQSFRSQLNEHLLLPNDEVARALCAERLRLADLGRDVERVGAICPISIFIRR